MSVIFVDIDNTICISSLDYNTATPLTPRIAKINELFTQGNKIVYWTARGTKTGIDWYKITETQLQSWGCKYTELRMGKPVYDLFIDDKNINSETLFSK